MLKNYTDPEIAKSVLTLHLILASGGSASDSEVCQYRENCLKDVNNEVTQWIQRSKVIGGHTFGGMHPKDLHKEIKVLHFEVVLHIV